MSTLPTPHPSLPARPTFGLPSKPTRAPTRGQRSDSTPAAGQTTTAKGDTEEDLLTPWLEHLPATEYNSTEQRLHDELVAFVAFATPSAAERNARNKLVQKLTEIVHRRYWTADVNVFGSIAQDLSLLSGDIDIVVNTPLVTGDENRKRGLFQLSRILRDAGFSHNPFVVKNARVPILTFETPPELGSVKFDLSINSTDGLTVLSKIKEYLDTMPALRPLIMTIKMFLVAKGLQSAASGGLGSYTLTLMVISFLQLNPGNRPAEDYDNPMVSESLGRLLMDFFDYYHDKFPYETSYISVLDKNLGSKSSKGWEREHHPDALSVESIINPDLDVGRACQKISRIRTAFGEAYAALKAYQVRDTAPDGSVVWRGNVLGSVLGVPASFVAHRADLEARLASGALDAALARIPLPDSWDRPPTHVQARRGDGRERGMGGYLPRDGGREHLGQDARDRQRGRYASVPPERQYRDRRDDDRRAGGSRYADPPAYRRPRQPEYHDARSHSYPYPQPNGSRCPW